MAIISLCCCEHESQQCPIQALVNNQQMNQFTTLHSWTETFHEIGDLNPLETDDQQLGVCRPGYKMWTWNTYDNCQLYYVFIYNAKGDRVREHEIVAPPKKNHHQIPEMLTLKVIPLYKKMSGQNEAAKHGFVEIRDAVGYEKYLMVIDLLSSPSPSGRYPIYFGFLCPFNGNFEKSIRVAVRNEKVTDTAEAGVFHGRNVDAVRNEIHSAIKAGGPYNMKYLACTEIEGATEIWIAMELCRMEILIHLIKAEEGSPSFVGHPKMKICFDHILQGLMQLHQNNIQHGDIAAHNILVSIDGTKLKVGYYHHAEVAQEANLHEKDIMMTARLFLKCLKKDGGYTKPDLDDADRSKIKTWILSPIPDRDVVDPIPENSLSRIVEMVFFNANVNSIHNFVIGNSDFGQSPSWFMVLMKLVEELSACDEPYLSSYLVMHMALDKPQADQIRTHPFFWDEYKMDCFIHQMLIWFEKGCGNLSTTISKDNGRVALDIGYELLESCRKALRLTHFEDDMSYTKLSKVVMESNQHVHNAIVCFLHRAVWHRLKSSTDIPCHIKRFFKSRSDSESLGLP